MSETQATPCNAIIMGDLYGCLTEIRALLDVIEPTAGDRIAVLDDPADCNRLTAAILEPDAHPGYARIVCVEAMGTYAQFIEEAG